MTSVRIRPLHDPIIKIKKTHVDAKLPAANNKQPGTGDTGFDLVSVENKVIPPMGSQVVPVGLTVADISPGYWFRIEPRSGLGFKHNIQPHLGVIDNGYRGDLGVKLYNFSTNKEYRVKSGDKIAQLVVYPLLQPIFEFTDEITETARGDNGFGSSDIESGKARVEPPREDPTLDKSGNIWMYTDHETILQSSQQADKEYMLHKMREAGKHV